VSIDWKSIATAPKDRAIYLWADREGVAKMKWFENQFSEYWIEVPADDDPRRMICSTSSPVYTCWCEVVELEPLGAKKFVEEKFR